VLLPAMRAGNMVAMMHLGPIDVSIAIDIIWLERLSNWEKSRGVTPWPEQVLRLIDNSCIEDGAVIISP
jgi:hypothetical protein